MKGHLSGNMSAKPVCLSDFEQRAKRILPKAIFDYYFSGADEQESLADNEAAFKRYVIGVMAKSLLCSVSTQKSQNCAFEDQKIRMIFG